jgi:hypothetical protein
VSVDAAKEAWDKADDLYEAEAPLAKQRAAAKKVIEAAGDDEQAEYYREKAEDRLLELAGKGSAADRKRGEREWLVLARKRLPKGEVWSVARATRHLRMKRVPDEVVHALTNAWAQDRLDKLCVSQERTDGNVKDRWRPDVVPSDALDAIRFAREAYRNEQWAQVIACVDVVDATKGDISPPSHIKADIKRNTTWAREHGRLLRIAALHLDGRPNRALLRAAIEHTLKRSEKNQRAAYALPWDTVAALIIAHGLIDDAAEMPLVQKVATTWEKDDWLGVPALLALRPPKAP